MLNKILKKLGLRTKCCGAKSYSPYGWDRVYCENCKKRV